MTTLSPVRKGGRLPPPSLFERVAFPFVALPQAVAGVTREQYRKAKAIAEAEGISPREAYKRARILSLPEMGRAVRGAWQERLSIPQALEQMEVPEMGAVTLPTVDAPALGLPQATIRGRTIGGGQLGGRLPGSGARITGRGVVGTALEFGIPTPPVGQALRAGAKVTGLAPKMAGMSASFLKRIEALRSPSAKVPTEVAGKFAVREAGIRVGAEAAEEAGKVATKGLSRAERLRLGQVLRGGITTKPELAERAAKMRGLREPITKRLVGELKEAGKAKWEETAEAIGRKVAHVEEGAVGRRATGLAAGLDDPLALAKQIESTMDTYIPTLYHEFEDMAKGIGSGKLPRLKMDRLLRKKDWPREIKRLRMMGKHVVADELDDYIKSLSKITEPGYPFAKGMAQVAELTETSKLIRWLDSNFASATKMEGMTQLPTKAQLGSLSGKFIDKGIAEMMMSRGIMRTPSGVYRKALGMWKGGKVLLNPATQVRNHMSDSFLMHLSGMPLYRQPAYLIRAAREYLGKGEMFKEFRRSGALRAPWYRAEISSFLEGMEVGGNPITRGAHALIKAGGKTYEAGEELRKMALYMFQKDQGKSMKEAAAFTRKWLFDYSDIPQAIRWVKNSPVGAPFITFQYKAIPRVAEAAVEETGRMAGLMKGFTALNTPPSQKEYEALPDHLKQGLKIRLPFADSKDRPLYFDLDYIVPWGIFGEAVQRGPAAVMPVNPVFTILADLYRNKNVFGYPIWKDIDTGDEKVKKVANYLYKQLMPSFAPEILPEVTGIKGGYSWEKLISALKGKPDYWGDVRDIPTTFLDVFLGLKMRPVDVKRERMFRRWEQQETIGDLQRKIKSITRDARIPKEEKKTKIAALKQRIIDLRRKRIR